MTKKEHHGLIGMIGQSKNRPAGRVAQRIQRKIHHLEEHVMVMVWV